MTAEELMAHVQNLESAAEVLEAIDDPALQRRRGWDLGGWRYELVPWGVRFVRRDRNGGETELYVVTAWKQGLPGGLPAGGVRLVLSTSDRRAPAGLPG